MDSDSILAQDFPRVADAWLFRENEPDETQIDPPENSGGGLAGEDHKHDYDDPPDCAVDPPENVGGGH